MTATTSYRAGEILLVDYPFVGGQQSKIRPALVILDTGDLDILLARITSQSSRTQHDVTLTDYQGAGLLYPSVVRLHKLTIVPRAKIIHAIGSLQPADRQRIAAVLNQMFANW